jgi:predicted lactoylglutathione lyase
MELGAFSISLSVKDLEASKSFYEKLGFHVFGGDAAQNWLIMNWTQGRIKFMLTAK